MIAIISDQRGRWITTVGPRQKRGGRLRSVLSRCSFVWFRDCIFSYSLMNNRKLLRPSSFGEASHEQASCWLNSMAKGWLKKVTPSSVDDAAFLARRKIYLCLYFRDLGIEFNWKSGSSHYRRYLAGQLERTSGMDDMRRVSFDLDERKATASLHELFWRATRRASLVLWAAWGQPEQKKLKT